VGRVPRGDRRGCGLHPGAIYKNFGSKEELFFAVSDRDSTAKLHSFSERLDQGAELLNPPDLAALWRDTMAGDADLAQHGGAPLRHAQPKGRARFAEHQRAMRQALAQFIVDRTAATGLTLTIPAMTLAGLLDADAHLLESFFALIVNAACDERPAVPAASRASERGTPRAS